MIRWARIVLDTLLFGELGNFCDMDYNKEARGALYIAFQFLSSTREQYTVGNTLESSGNWSIWNAISRDRK